MTIPSGATLAMQSLDRTGNPEGGKIPLVGVLPSPRRGAMGSPAVPAGDGGRPERLCP